MSYELIICEKPAAAQKVAEALADGKIQKKEISKAPYFEIEHKSKKIVVTSAIGHLFSLAESKKNGYKYPVFDVVWKPIFEVRKDAGHAKNFYQAILSLAKDATMVTLACDYDVEGSTIGWTCIHLICKRKDGHRMKFSTLTKDDLIESYEHASPHLDFPQIKAGETRHKMDYFWGISLSRALMAAIKAAGSFKIMSSGRVQGPALKIVVDRERDIKKFIPQPYWEIELEAEVNKQKLLAGHEKNKFWEQKNAQSVFEKVKGKDGVVEKLEEKEVLQPPPHPFDLTALQLESYRCFGISPKETQAIAQDLYVAGLISYPRTSSQQLPPALNFKKILTNLGKQPSYAVLTKKILALPSLQPNNGKKSDPAHPAVHPTGESAAVADKKRKVYDLIVHRFLATFAPPAKRKSVTATINVNNELFIAHGISVIEPGWQSFYDPYTSFKEEILPLLTQGQEIKNPSITLEEDQTKPPKRFTAASIIKELEKKNLGTKATRAQIVDSLVQRNYIQDKAIMATELGIATIDILEKYCPEIIDEKLTRHFEEEMEEIQEEKKEPNEILEEAKKSLTEVLDRFRKQEKAIGSELLVATRETQRIASTIGECPVCKQGQITLRKGRFGMFAACNRYPDCKTTFSVPKDAMLKPIEEKCPSCGYHMLLVIRRGRRPWNYCLNKICPKKEEWRKMMEEKNQKKDAMVESPSQESASTDLHKPKKPRLLKRVFSKTKKNQE